MATTDFVKIAVCGNAIEAEQLRNVLEQHGVVAFVDGAAANTAMSYVGTALGGVRVLVAKADEARAIDAVEQFLADSDVARTPWYCGKCNETIDGAFELCWSCGNSREDVEQPLPKQTPAARVAPETEKEARIVGPVSTYSGYDAANPYASPVTLPHSTHSAGREETSGQFDEDAEAMLLRAWKASIIGMVFLPVVLHLYSMYLLILAAGAAESFTPIGTKRFYRTLAVNVIAGCLFGVFLRYVMIW